MDITTSSLAHITAQIRVKQLATKHAQDDMKSLIETFLHDNDNPISPKGLIQYITKYLNTSRAINKVLNRLQPEEIGFPCKSNKTEVQAKLALDFVSSQSQQEDQVIHNIMQGKFHNYLGNKISRHLPSLKSNSKEIYWGNENASVSSFLLLSIIEALGIRYNYERFCGAATFYKFRNYTFPSQEDIVQDYPFARKDGLVLLGSYQFGGHRDFGQSFLLSPEDCSSSVGKAIGLTDRELTSFSTSSLQDAYFLTTSGSRQSANYVPITHSGDNGASLNLNLIQAGDIYLVQGHTALIVTKPDNKGNITTLQFTRDIDVDQNKFEGGGILEYKLTNISRKVYILRPSQNNLRPLHESGSLSDLLDRIDDKYCKLFRNGPKDVVGDCNLFL